MRYSFPGGLKIAFTSEARQGLEVHLDCVRSVHDTAALCQELSHIVEECALEPNDQELAKSFLFRFATHLEAARPWSARRPPFAA